MLLTEKSKNEVKNERWQEANRHYLMSAIDLVSQNIKNYLARLQNQPLEEISSDAATTVDIEEMAVPPALDELCATFELSDFERDILLLCVGVELKSSLAWLCGEAQGDPQLNYGTFGLAIAALPKAHWNAITPDAPLRRWRLIEVELGQTLTCSPLRIDERILHYLVGVESVDERLKALISPIAPSDELVASHSKLAQQVAAIWSQGKSGAKLPIIQLCGEDVASMRAIASTAAATLGLQLNVMSAMAIPTAAGELNNLLLLWEREAKLRKSVLLLDTEIDGVDPARESAIAHIIENTNSLLIVTSRDRISQRQRALITLEVRRPTKDEQRLLWQEALEEMAPNLDGVVEVLVNQFNLNTPTIHAVCTEVRGRLGEGGGDGEMGRGGDGENNQLITPNSSLITSNSALITPFSSLLTSNSSLSTALWDTCRAQARPRLDDLAQPLIPRATWNDLVLTEIQRQTLQSIAAHLRQCIQVYQKWGFAGTSGRGLGISALFAGTSGTGKTTSAEVIAHELRLDLYRIDLSSVVSKYIGETEKNLGRIFDAAEGGAAILLFDEADALFGKRSDVKDSRDRYANMEVAYLLQRMEEYQGLAILTTNLKDSIDTAFLRRIRFIVKYSFPDASQREEIWRRIFPKKTPTEGLDYTRLGRLNVAGGNIRNIALNAAFLAADAGESVMMKHIKIAAQNEYVKLERTLTDAEVKGWV